MRYLLKFIIVGNSGVGKTSLATKFADNQIVRTHMTTIGVDFKVKMVELDDQIVKIHIWDTAGQEKFKSITKAYYQCVAGAMVCYDITDRHSFHSVQSWLNEVKSMCPETVSVILVGTKSDCEERYRQVSKEEGQKFAEDNGLLFTETFVTDYEDQSVNEVFTKLIVDVKSRIDEGVLEPNKDNGIKVFDIQDDRKPVICYCNIM